MHRTQPLSSMSCIRLACLAVWLTVSIPAFAAVDPGVQHGNARAGFPLAGLNARELQFFDIGKEDFEEFESVADGIGPRFNLDGCAGCHAQPEVGGTSPATNPQVAIPSKFPGNVLPSFVTSDGPIREARFKRLPSGRPDNGVHNLFVITGNPGAPGCQIVQENFAAQLAANNVIFRIPTPVFGAGLIEQIPDAAIRANVTANAAAKQALGIFGRVNLVQINGDLNTNGNDGTVSRFGWKAQNKSLLLFSGEAYNVEMGITNELFQTEREENAACQFADHPNSVTDSTTPQLDTVQGISSIEKFAFFMRFLAPPMPSPDTPGGASSIQRGRASFEAIGCGLCHTPTMRTAKSTVGALSEKDVNLFSDLLLHNMGVGLADGIVQGQAGGDEFRTAPLWGLGQRIFLLHDGRTTDLVQAIRAHRSFGSEANGVISRFDLLLDGQKQNLLNFLRSL